MINLKQGLLNLTQAWHAVKEKNLHWRQLNQHTQQQLRRQHLLAEQAISAELKQKHLQLAHQINLLQSEYQAELNQLKINQNAQLTMLKTKCQQDIKDYQQYLHSLEQLKRSIQISYSHLPEAVAFTIHHHAKYLLNEMWEAKTLEQKLRQEMCFITFMATVHEDAQLQLSHSNQTQLPENTLRLLNSTSK
ncbi:MAG: hypothetical protein WAX77_00515 [Methylococcaceae bacterium]